MTRPPMDAAHASSVMPAARAAPNATPVIRHFELPHAFLARYRLGKLLGQGGFGLAYAARDSGLNREVAVKPLLRHDDPGQLARCLREGQLLGRINHLNVLKVYDFTQVMGHPCLVMEVVEGGSLRQRVIARPPLAEGLEVTAAILDGLGACHAAGVLRRDQPGKE